ncbi:MAG: hypothetical protein VX498_01195 [Myxococcota bacterium]|nr:hypothetical protein [Myxococcota bacterium]
MRTLSFFATFRLAVWRELYARVGLLGILLALAAIEAVLPDHGREPWEPFVLWMVLPPLSVVLALRGPATADSFWRGLGGSSAARGLATAAVHLGALCGTAGVLALGAAARGELIADPEVCSLRTYCGLLGSLWALVFAGRAVARGLVAVVPLLVAGAGLYGAILLAPQGDRWPEWEAICLRIFLLGGAALLLGLLLEGPVGAWGGAVRKRGFGLRSLLCVLCLVLLASLGVEAASPPHWRVTGAEWSYVSPDGALAFRQTDPYGEQWTPWTQRWTPEGGLEWWKRSGEERPSWDEDRTDGFAAGPKGAFVLGGEVTWPDGSTTSCEAADLHMSWSPDGRAAVLVSTDGEGTWVIATPQGCTTLPASVHRPRLRAGGELVFVRDRILFVGPSVEAARPVPFPDGQGSERLWVSGGSTVTLVGRVRENQQTLWMLRGDRLRPLATGSLPIGPATLIRPGWGRSLGSFRQLDGCVTLDMELSCWDAAGERSLGPLSGADREGLVVLEKGWLWNLEDNSLERPRDGSRVPVAGASVGEHRSNRYLEHIALLPDGRARYFGRGGTVRDFELPDELNR